MDTKQITLDGYVKSQKRPTNNDGVYKKAQMNSTIGVVKLSRQLSFDSSPQQTIKKQKVESDKTQTIFHDNLNVTYSTNTNTNADNTLETTETKHKNEVEPEKARTPDQSPSTKAKLHKELGLGEFRKIVRHKNNFKKLQEKLSSVEQCKNYLKSSESKVEATKCHSLSSFKSIDLMADTSLGLSPGFSPTKQPRLHPKVLFPSSAYIINPSKLMMQTHGTLPKVTVSPGKLLDEIESLLALTPTNRFSALADPKALPLPLKYRNLDELFKAIETVLSVIFKRKEKITFNKLKRCVQHMTRKNFTELHLAQIKTIVPDFFELSLMKSSRNKTSFELVIAPVYGLENEDNVDLTQLTTLRKKKFSNSLLDIMKKYHKEYLNKLTPPIVVIDEDKIKRWHPEFDVESVADIPPSSLPKIEINKPKIATAKDISDRSHALFVYNNLLNRTFSTKNEENKDVNEKIISTVNTKMSTEDSKSALKGALTGIPKSFLSKVQDKQDKKNIELMTRSLGQLDEDGMIKRLPDIAQRMCTYFVQLKKNVLPLKKVIDQLNQSYPEAMADQDWKAHINLLQEKVPRWILTQVKNGVEYIRINKKIRFEENVIEKLKK